MLQKIKDRIHKFLRSENTLDIISFLKFIIVHGILGMFVVLTIISIVGIKFVIVEYIRQSVTLTTMVFLIGSGASYYLLMDISKFYNELKMLRIRK